MLEKRVQVKLEAIRRLMRKGAVANLRRIVARAHPVDLAVIYGELNDLEQGRFFQILKQADRVAELLAEMEPRGQQALLASMSPEELALILPDMDTDDAADLLNLLPEDTRRQVLDSMGTEDSQDLGLLMDYPPDSAGGIMTTEFVSLPASMTAGDAVEALQGLQDAETAFYLYVVDDAGKLVGVVSLRHLITSARSTPLSAIMATDVVSVETATDQEHVARLVAKYDLLAIPVVDEEKKLVGIITVDDVLDVMRQEATEDIYKMAGTSQEELVYGNQVLPIVRLRLPWLLVSLFGGMLTGTILWLFRATVTEIIALVSFVPVVSGMGGNVGTQSSAILVRAFATGRVDFTNLAAHVWKELRVGLLMGVLCGLIVGLVALVWHQSPYLGIVVGFSMICALTVAAIMGTLAPAALRKMNVDPAVAAGPFVSMANDLTGYFIYLGTATLLLPFLR